jgi:hypothetical protein
MARQISDLFAAFGEMLPIGVNIYMRSISIEFQADNVSTSTVASSTVQFGLADMDAKSYYEYVRGFIGCDTIVSITLALSDSEWLPVLEILKRRTNLVDLILNFGDLLVDQQVCGHIAMIIRNNRYLRKIKFTALPVGDTRDLDDAIVCHSSLKSLGWFSSSSPIENIITIVQHNRVLGKLCWGHGFEAPAQHAELLRVLRNNWALRKTWGPSESHNWDIAEVTGSGGTHLIHELVSKAIFGLLPLGMAPYEMLWIIDWLPPMSTRYVWASDGVNVDYSYDPYHGKKIALISGIVNSYRRVLEDRI